MRYNKMSVAMVSLKFGLWFAPECKSEISLESIDTSKNVNLHCLQETMDSVELLKAECSDVSWCTLISEFQVFFSSVLGMAKCAPYVIELADSTSVRSSPYRFAPPKLKCFREMVDDLL
jgi:hypothetical protein